MNIAVVAAGGKSGRKIVAEANSRGINVTAFVRKPSEIVGADKVIVKDIFALKKDDLADFDAVVDAFGAWTTETLPQHSTSLKKLCDLVSGTDIRLLIVGGAGSLYTNPEHTAQVADSPDFPADWKPLAAAMATALEEIRKRNDVKWTYISPACDFQADGERTGKYIVGGEELILNSAGESVISYSDYAIALIDEILSGNNIKKRISVVKA